MSTEGRLSRLQTTFKKHFLTHHFSNVFRDDRQTTCTSLDGTGYRVSTDIFSETLLLTSFILWVPLFVSSVVDSRNLGESASNHATHFHWLKFEPTSIWVVEDSISWQHGLSGNEETRPSKHCRPVYGDERARVWTRSGLAAVASISAY